MAPYDHLRVREQQQGFAELLEGHGARVLWADPLGASVSQHYTRDIALAIDETVFVARPRRAARQAELPGLRRVLPQLSSVTWLDAGRIEGGDVIVDTDHLIVGPGEETERAGVEALRHRLRALGSGRKVTVLELARRGAIHTDTLFTVVAPGLALVHRPWFTPASVRWMEEHYDLIDVTERQRRGLSVNTFSINPTTVVVRDDGPLAEALTAKGMTVLVHDYSEVMRLPGSFRCTTMPVRRTPAA